MMGVVLASMTVYAVLSLAGIQWGLPSRERLALYDASYGEVVGSGEDRLFVTGPLQSYQVDECSVLIPLSRMDPRRLQLNPKWFHWGTLHIYVIGVVLWAAQLLGVVTLTASRQFYLGNPEELATVYLIVRWVSWALGLASLVLCAVLLRRVTRSLALFAATLLMFAVSPLVVLYGAFGTPDMAIVFWVLVSAVLAGVGHERQPGRLGLLLAFAAAGAAGSVKLYGGAAIAFPFVQAVRSRSALLPGLLCAGLAFVAGSPYVILDWPTFRADLAWQWNHMHQGHGMAFLGTRPGFLHHWLETLPAATSPLTTVIMALALAGALVRWRSARLPVVAFLGLFWLQLARSPLKFARYALPIIPLQLLLVAWLLAEARSRLVQRAGIGLLLAALASEAMLAAGHAGVFREPDVRDRASAWLASHGAPGDVVAVFGKPYFATPPLSQKRFGIVIAPLDLDALKKASPQWVILSDYDTEPVFRFPQALPVAHEALSNLLGASHSVMTFSSAPTPPLIVSWGRVLLPHDMRYHCPTIWIVGT
ncbi:phospholipid carrier-dependent glycosyltransferase [Candidatus Fermentibacteria bacterium]|nr:phospholipid carrier-dependent glycosyltransferase [Candidatus Fermentibacteria bacterium]